MSSARATKSSGDTRSSANSGSSRTRRSAAIVSVTSTCRNSVTCGAVNALDTMAAAMCLRTPRTGIRSSPPRLGAVGGWAVRTPFSTAEYPERTWVSAAAARCTSSRVIEPSGPLPASSPRLMPRSLASLRTGGLASARTAGTAGSAGSSGGSAGTSGTVGTSATSAPTRGRDGRGVLRARRVVDDGLDAVADQDRVPSRLARPSGSSPPRLGGRGALGAAVLSAGAGAGTTARSG